MKRLPVVCTNDSRTMSSEEARAAYKTVNSRNNLEEVEFLTLNEFKRLI